MKMDERSNVNLSALVRVLGAFVVLAAFLYAGVWGLYQHFRTQDESRNVRRSLVEAGPPVPPEPRLQINPQEEFQKYLRKQKEILNSYGWVSREAGVVRIPIDRAMELVVEREKR
jgi:hypothetical protein